MLANLYRSEPAVAKEAEKPEPTPHDAAILPVSRMVQDEWLHTVFRSPTDTDNLTQEDFEKRDAYRSLMLKEPAISVPYWSRIAAVSSREPIMHADDPDNPKSVEVAEFTKYAIGCVQGGWPGIIKAFASGGLLDGFAILETVYDFPERGQWQSKRWVLKEAAPLDGRFIRFDIDRFKRIVGVRGLKANAGKMFLPDRFAFYVHNQLFNNPFGISQFRSAYRAAVMMESAIKLRIILLQNYSGPFLAFKSASTTSRETAMKIVAQARSLGYLVCSTDDDVQVLNMAAGTDSQFQSALDDLRKEMYTAIAWGSLPFMEGRDGAEIGNSQVQKSITELNVWQLATGIAESINRYIIPNIVKANFADESIGYPRLSLGGESIADRKAKADLYDQAKRIGIPLSKKQVQRDLGLEEPNGPEDEVLAPMGPGGGNPMVGMPGLDPTAGGIPGMDGGDGGGAPPDGAPVPTDGGPTDGADPASGAPVNPADGIDVDGDGVVDFSRINKHIGKTTTNEMDKAALIAALDLQAKAVTVGRPGQYQRAIDALRGMIGHHPALRAAIQEHGTQHDAPPKPDAAFGWQPEQTRTGHLKAVGYAEHAGRTLYGADAQHVLDADRRQAAGDIAGPGRDPKAAQPVPQGGMPTAAPVAKGPSPQARAYESLGKQIGGMSVEQLHDTREKLNPSPAVENMASALGQHVIEKFHRRDTKGAATRTLKDHLDNATGITPDQWDGYHAAVEKATQRMPKAAHERIAANLAGASFHPDPDSIGDGMHADVMSLAGTPEKAVEYAEKFESLKGKKLGAAYCPTKGTIHIDGDAENVKGRDGKYGTEGAIPAHEVYAHVLGHVLDGPDFRLSGSQAWQTAHKREMAGRGADGQHKLTNMAGTSPEEGLAEFARLVYASDVPHAQIAKDFPQATAIFRQQGLWPSVKDAPLPDIGANRPQHGKSTAAMALYGKDRGDRSGSMRLRELFSERVEVAPDRSHVDVLASVAAADSPKPTDAPTASGADKAPWSMSPDESKQAGMKFFRTAKGSLYVVHPKTGQTIRVKSDHSGISGGSHDATDVGLKKSSDKTIYVKDKDRASGLSTAGLSGVKSSRVFLKDGKATLLTKNEVNGQWGATQRGRDVEYSETPQVGWHPVELYSKKSNDTPFQHLGNEVYGGMHTGNAIAEEVAHDQGHAELTAAATKAGKANVYDPTRAPIAPEAAQTSEKPAELPQKSLRANGTPIAPHPDDVHTVPVSALKRDPARMQYKVTGIGAGGVGEELKGVSEWNPHLGGSILAWRDPATDEDIVVNGHHRHELAQRTGRDTMNARWIQAKTAQEARSIGALANIAEGRGSAVDAAKYLRDSGQDVEHLRNAGVSLSGKVAQDALHLKDLNSQHFAKLVNGDLDEKTAVTVAKHVKDPNLQNVLFHKIAANDWNASETETAAKKIANAGKVTKTENTLFGELSDEHSTFDQEVELETLARRKLSQNANDFRAVANTGRAERVADAGNILVTDENKKRAENHAERLERFNREAHYVGPVSAAIKTAAAQLATAKDDKERNRVRASIHDLVGNALDGGAGSDSGSGAASPPIGTAAGAPGAVPPESGGGGTGGGGSPPADPGAGDGRGPVIAPEPEREAAPASADPRQDAPATAKDDELASVLPARPDPVPGEKITAEMAGGVKEPWQMTKAEYESQYGTPRKGATTLTGGGSAHKEAVATQLNRNQGSVSAEVLADYPDLAPKTAAPVAEPPASSPEIPDTSPPANLPETPDSSPASSSFADKFAQAHAANNQLGLHDLTAEALQGQHGDGVRDAVGGALDAYNASGAKGGLKGKHAAILAAVSGETGGQGAAPAESKAYPEPGDRFTFPASHTTGEFEAVLKDHGSHVGFDRADGGAMHGTKIRKEQFPQFLDDLRGVVRAKGQSGHPSVDAVTGGKAKFLARGNDGLAFDAGDGNVVKVASDLPFHWNNGLRRAGEGSEQLKAAVALNEKMRSEGVPGLLPQQLVEHEGRAFAVMPKLDTTTKLNQEQFDQVAGTVKAMHDRGYSAVDELQVGLKDGKPYIYDTGAMRPFEAKHEADDRKDDESRLERLAKANGVDFVSSDPDLHFSQAVDDAQKFLGHWQARGKKPPPTSVKHHVERLQALRGKVSDEAAEMHGYEDLLANVSAPPGEYKGPLKNPDGTWATIHGKYAGQGIQTATGQGINEAVKPDGKEDGEGGGKRVALSPEEAEEKRKEGQERARQQALWTEIGSGPLAEGGKWFGDSPNSKALQGGGGRDIRKWRQFAEKIGPAAVKSIIDRLEPDVHVNIDAETKRRNLSDENGEWAKGKIKEHANEMAGLHGGKGHEKAHPGSHYAGQLIGEALEQNPSVDGFHKIHTAVNEAIQSAHAQVREQPIDPVAHKQAEDADAIPRVSNDEFANGSWDMAHAGLTSEAVAVKMALGMKGIEGREYGIRQHSPGKWQMVSKPMGAKGQPDRQALQREAVELGLAPQYKLSPEHQAEHDSLRSAQESRVLKPEEQSRLLALQMSQRMAPDESRKAVSKAYAMGKQSDKGTLDDTGREDLEDLKSKIGTRDAGLAYKALDHVDEIHGKATDVLGKARPASSWDDLPDVAKNLFDKRVLTPLKEQVGDLDRVASNTAQFGGGMRYAWETASKGGTVKPGAPHAGSEGLKAWSEAAKSEGHDPESLIASHPEYSALVAKLDKYRGWGDEPEGTPPAEAARPHTYFKGDRAEYTGVVNPDGSHEIEVMEGANKGEKKLTFTKSDGTNPLQEQSKDQWREQQRQFSNLNKPPAEEEPAASPLDDATRPAPMRSTSTGQRDIFGGSKETPKAAKKGQQITLMDAAQNLDHQKAEEYAAEHGLTIEARAAGSRFKMNGEWYRVGKGEDGYPVEKEGGEEKPTAEKAGLHAFAQQQLDEHRPILEKQVASETDPRRQWGKADGVLHGLNPDAQKALLDHLATIAPKAYEYGRANPPLHLANVLKGMNPPDSAGGATPALKEPTPKPNPTGAKPASTAHVPEDLRREWTDADEAKLGEMKARMKSDPTDNGFALANKSLSKNQAGWQAELAAHPIDRSAPTAEAALGIAEFDSRKGSHVGALGELYRSVFSHTPGAAPGNDPMDQAIKKFESAIGLDWTKAPDWKSTKAKRLEAAGKIIAAAEKLGIAKSPEAEPADATAPKATGDRSIGNFTNVEDRDGHTVGRQTKFAGAGKFAVIDEAGNPVGPYRETAESAVADHRTNLADAESNRAAHNRRAELKQKTHLTEAEAHEITDGPKMTKTNAVYLLRNLKGGTFAEATKAIQKLSMAGETSGGAVLYHATDVLRAAGKTIGEPNPTDNAGLPAESTPQTGTGTLEATPRKNPFREEHDKLQKRIEQLTGQTSHDKAMEQAFPFGTGRPGNASSQRTSKQSDKRIETTVNNAVKANELIKKQNELKAKADQFDSGIIDEHGRETAETLASRAEKEAVAKKGMDAVNDYMRETLKPGSVVYVSTGNAVAIKRVNPTGITTEGGAKFKFEELAPKHPSEDRAMTAREMVDLAKSRTEQVKQTEAATAPTELAAEPAETTPTETAAAAPATGSYSLKDHDDVAERAMTGELNAEQFREAYKHFRAHEPALKAELGHRNVAQLRELVSSYGGFPRNDGKKADLVNDVYGKMAHQLMPIGGAYNPMAMTHLQFLDTQAVKVTDKDLADRAERVRAARAEHAERRKTLIASVTEPKTYEDFETFARLRGTASMTPEQQEKWDELKADKRREGQKAKRLEQATVTGFTPGAAATGNVGIVEGHHKKRNAPTFTVTVQEHLGDNWSSALERAKRLGGSYVNGRIARAYGATPGFQFFDKTKAEEFAKVLGGESVDQSQTVEQREAERIANRAAGLTEKGAGLQAEGQESHDAQRRENTYRQSEQAANARAEARKKIAHGRTLERLGQAMESGELKHLNGVRSAADLDSLNRILQTNKYARFQAEQKENPAIRYEEYMQKPHAHEDIQHVVFPYPHIWSDDLRKMAKAMQDEPGLVRAADKLLKAGNAVNDIKFQTTVGGMKAGGGRLLTAKTFAEHPQSRIFSQYLKDQNGEETGVRVHASRDYRLVQGAEAEGVNHTGAFYTADKGQTWGVSPEASVAAAISNGKPLDLMPVPQEKLLTLADPDHIEAMRKAARRLKNHPNRELKSIGESMADKLEHHDRLIRADITNGAELRAALREYLPLRADADREDPVKKMERDLKGADIPGFFPTPRRLIDQMIDRAGIESGHSVLEPSAGKGDILDAIAERHPDATGHAIEPHSSLRKILEAKGHTLVDHDVMEHQGAYDRVLMNPPFENGQDAQHVQKAYDLLKPGGRLVAVMSAGPFLRGDKKASAFREWLDTMDHEAHDLPEGAFAGNDAFRKTGVRTKLLTVNKPE